MNATALTYDANRNLIHDELRAYTYDAAGRMLSVANSPFSYDPVGNLHRAGNALLMSMVGGERLALHAIDAGEIKPAHPAGGGPG